MAEVHDIYLDAVPIAEMDAGVEDYVPLDPKIVNKIKLEMEDDDPQFPVIKLEAGVSKNKFEWTPEILESIAEQVNENQPVGYLGHIKPEDERWVLPAPQTWWLKAVTKSDGKKKALYVKGYNLPDEPIRKYNKAGVVNSVSVHGKASVQHVKGGIQRVAEFALESIDWSRKGKSAMSARLVTVAAEMEGKEDNEVSDLSKVTIAEVKTEAPSLYQLIVNEAQAEQNEKIEELEEKVKDVDENVTLFAKLRDALGIDEKTDILDAVVQMITKIEDAGRKTVNEKLSEILGEKIKDDDARSVVMRLMPVSEMADLDDDALKVKVNEMIDNDEGIKSIINRVAGSPGPRKNGDGGSGDGEKDRYASGKSTGNIKVTRTKL
jgi:hypothetical protein